MHEVDHDRQPDLPVAEHLPQLALLRCGRLLCGQAALDVLGVGSRQPRCRGWTVRQLLPHHIGQGYGGQAFEHEQPLPAMPAQYTVQLQQGTAQRAAKDVGQAHTQQEVPRGTGALFAVEPVGQVQHYPGEQASFGDPQQQAHDVERGFTLNEGHACREQTPGNHDTGDPEARAHPVHDQVAGHFGQGIGKEEQARAQAIGGCRKAQVDAHAGFRQGDVGAVKKAHHVDNDEQWHQFA
ncbi:hypothetical protein D9M71_359730 [compost metagenome]